MTAALQDGSAFADGLLQRIGQSVGDKAKVSTVFGEAIERADVTVVPVAKARFVFGGGGGAGARGSEEGSGGGGGGGALVSPVGYIEIRDGSKVTCSGTARDYAALLAVQAKLRAADGVSGVKLEQIRGKAPMQFVFGFNFGNGGGNEN